MNMAIKTIFVSAIGVLLSALLTGCATDRAVVEQAQQYDQTLEKAVIKDPQLESYFNRIGQRIIEAAKEAEPEAHRTEDSGWMFSKNMQFHLVNSKTLNA